MIEYELVKYSITTAMMMTDEYKVELLPNRVCQTLHLVCETDCLTLLSIRRIGTLKNIRGYTP